MHKALQDFRQFVFCFFTPRSMEVFNNALMTAYKARFDPLQVAYAVAEMIASPRSIGLFSKAWLDKPAEQRPIPPTAA